MGSIFQKPPNNYQYLVGVENAADYETIPISVTNPTAETTLQTVTLIAGALNRDGQRIKAIAIGTHNLSAGGPPFRGRLNGTQVFQRNFPSAGALRAWRCEIEVFRRATSLIVLSNMLHSILIAPTISTALSVDGNYIEFTNFNFDSQIDISWTADLSGSTGTVTIDLAFLSIL